MTLCTNLLFTQHRRSKSAEAVEVAKLFTQILGHSYVESNPGKYVLGNIPAKRGDGTESLIITAPIRQKDGGN